MRVWFLPWPRGHRRCVGSGCDLRECACVARSPGGVDRLGNQATVGKGRLAYFIVDIELQTGLLKRKTGGILLLGSPHSQSHLSTQTQSL